MGAEVIRVFLVTENRLIQEALTRMLHNKGDIRVIGASGVSPQILAEASAALPDVLLSDTAIHALDTLAIIPELRKTLPALKVIMIGMENDSDMFLRAVRSGIAGYLLKEASIVEIAAAVRSVAQKEAVCPPCLLHALFETVQKGGNGARSMQIRSGLGLTRREQQLVQMISLGLTNKEIANQLNLSENTIKNHVHRILRKLGVNGRLGMVEACRVRELAA
jgi:DNA-binding NarL/FixJ family response regulator